jgi:polar amino acid transport system substrate-binding protein
MSRRVESRPIRVRRMRGDRWRMLASVVAVSCAALLAACGSSDPGEPQTKSGEGDKSIEATLPQSVKDSGVIKNIIFHNSPPATFQQGDEAVGWAVDLGEAIADVLGVELDTTVSGDFASFIPGLQSKRFDGSFGPLIVTPERLEQVDIVAVFEVGTGVVTKTGTDISVEDVIDLCGLSVAVIEGSAFVTSIEDIKPQCEAAGKEPMEIRSFPSNADAQLAVGNGRVQVFASNTDALQYLVSQTGDQFTLQPLEYNPILQGIGLTKDNGLAEPVAAAVDKLIADGTYDQILGEWGLERNAVNEAQINPATS